MRRRFTKKRLLLVCLLCVTLLAVASLRLTAVAQVPNLPSLVPTQPSLDPSLAPSTDPCGYPAPPTDIDCSTTPSGTPESVPSVTLPSPAPCSATASAPGVADIDAQKALASQGVSIQPISGAVTPMLGFGISSDAAKTTALSYFPESLVCAEFPALMSDPGSSSPTASPVYVLSLSPANPILSHPSHNLPPQTASFLFVFVDGQSGDMIQATAGGPNPPPVSNLPIATPTP